MEEDVKYRDSNLFHSEEPVARYRRDGYHPVSLGDTFKKGRYEIYNKLGWGGSSTVWLARNTLVKRWVSIKIITAKKSSSQYRELQNLQSLTERSDEATRSRFIVKLLDNFFHEGPNGRHLCLVFELFGPSIAKVLKNHEDLPGGHQLLPETIMRLSKKILQVVAFMHKHNYAHGDLHSGNICFTCHRLSTAGEDRLFEYLDYPYSVELVRLDGKPLDHGVPQEIIETGTWHDRAYEDNEDIRVIDLGDAFTHGAEPEELHVPRALQAPEMILTHSFDHRVDLWLAGHVIYQLVFQSSPFLWMGDDDFLILQMIDFLGGLPEEWHQKAKKLQEKSGHGSTSLDSLSSSTELQEKFDKEVEDRAVKSLLPVLQGLWRFKPSQRISAAEALDKDCFKPRKRSKKSKELGN